MTTEMTVDKDTPVAILEIDEVKIEKLEYAGRTSTGPYNVVENEGYSVGS